MKEELQLLQSAANEIKQLRNQNALMSARLEMFDKMMVLLHTEPNYPSMGMSQDLVREIERYIEISKNPINAD